MLEMIKTAVTINDVIELISHLIVLNMSLKVSGKKSRRKKAFLEGPCQMILSDTELSAPSRGPQRNQGKHSLRSAKQPTPMTRAGECDLRLLPSLHRYHPTGMLRHKGPKPTFQKPPRVTQRGATIPCHALLRKRERKDLIENAWDTPMVVTSKECGPGWTAGRSRNTTCHFLSKISCF